MSRTRSECGRGTRSSMRRTRSIRIEKMYGSLQTTNEFLSHKLLLSRMYWRMPKNVRKLNVRFKSFPILFHQFSQILM
jgi:phage-related protein